ncbi:MAG: zinc ribbon domain-containing protein [Coriobacteriaceae bacterium]|jgi:hypothetical protein|nr:zinc ribbon domain-containing protein [Coriobacteriaceae bacterium]
MFCPKCGTQLQEAAQFCGNCGSPIGDVPAPAPASDPVQNQPAPAPMAGNKTRKKLSLGGKIWSIVLAVLNVLWGGIMLLLGIDELHSVTKGPANYLFLGLCALAAVAIVVGYILILRCKDSGCKVVLLGALASFLFGIGYALLGNWSAGDAISLVVAVTIFAALNIGMVWFYLRKKVKHCATLEAQEQPYSNTPQLGVPEQVSKKNTLSPKKKKMILAIGGGAIAMAAILVVGIMVLTADPSPEKVLNNFSHYQPLADSENKAGIYIEKINDNSDSSVVVMFSNMAMLTEENTGVVLGRLHVYNAQSLSKPVDFIGASTHVTKTSYDASGAAKVTDNYYHPFIKINDKRIRYVLVHFEGVDASEAPELETAPCFFIVDLKKATVLTEVPLKAEPGFNQ